MRGPTWLALSFLAGSLACRPQPSAALVLDRDPADPQVEPSGLGDAPTVFVEPATRSTTPPYPFNPVLCHRKPTS